MKKLLFAAMAMTAILTSCSKNDENTNLPTDPADGPQVQITFKSGVSDTRAFFDESAADELWESEIKTLAIYVTDEFRNVYLRRFLTQTEINSKTAHFVLPNALRGKICTFYAVANEDYETLSALKNFHNRTESTTLDQYNGPFSQVSNGRVRDAGFVMTCETKSTIDHNGETTYVEILLKRVVAKIAVKTQLSADFSTTYYGGNIVITSATLSQIPETSYSFFNVDVYYKNVGNYSFTQDTEISGSEFRNLFYVYESTSLPQADKPKLVLSGYFDGDGNPSTTFDRLDVSYVIYLQGNNGGEIRRNTYHRIDATIKGLSGDDMIVDFIVADWETPFTQTVDLGE